MTFDQAMAYGVQEKEAVVRPARRREVSRLTRREREIAELVAQGSSNRDIAAALVIAQRTAECHVENILVKLGFTSRAQIAAWMAAQTGDGTGAS
jgi:DNA-binding NarL/FixJ family response regulator